jgi:hypothetical protein
MATERHEALKAKAREYLHTRGTRVGARVVHERVAAAFAALEETLDTVPAAQAGARPLPGEWTVQEVVDHLLETHRPGVDELRCLLAGQRPPGDAIPASLLSKAPALRPWPWLRRELRRVHDDILELLATVPEDLETRARAPLVMVVNAPGADGGIVHVHWVEELDWKAYSITWRLHALDHRNQIQKVLSAATAAAQA